MFKWTCLILMFVSLIGCAVDRARMTWQNVPHAYQKGKTDAQHNEDQLACQVKANKEVPPNNQVSTTPRFTVPTQCYSSGGVYTGGYITTRCYGGQTIGGQVQSTDVNASLRNRVYEQCMKKKGYSFVQYEYCSNDVIKRSMAKVKNKKIDYNKEMDPPTSQFCFYVDEQQEATVIVDKAKL